MAVEPFDYLESQTDADELIQEFGQSGAIRRTTTSGPEWDPVTVETDYPCTLVLLDYKQSDIDGTLILQNDKHVLVAAGGLGVVLTTADKLVLGGQALTMVNVSPLSPGGTVVLFDVQARL